MSQFTAEQATIVLNAVSLPALQMEHPTTERVIAAIPAAKGDYTPDAVSRSAIDLAWHIVTAECRFVEAVLTGAFDLNPWARPDTVRTGADVNAWYAPRFGANIGALQKLTGDQLARVIDFRGMFQLPAVAFLNLAVHHTIHHRGQLSTYLRPMGGKVPSIYGESYDARIAREQATAKA